MRQNTKDRLNKKLVNNDMVALNNDGTTLNSTVSESISTPTNMVLSDVQQEQLQRKAYDNYYSTLEESVTDPYPGHLQAIIQDDGKLFMVLLFTVGAFVIYELIKSKNQCEVNHK